MKRFAPLALALALGLAGCQDVTHPGSAAAPDRPAANSYYGSVWIDGPLEITEEGGYVYSVVDDGYGPNATYQWYIQWDRDNGYVRTLGTASTQQVNIIASEGNFRIFVDVQHGGTTSSGSLYVTNLMTCGQDYCPVSYP